MCPFRSNSPLFRRLDRNEPMTGTFALGHDARPPFAIMVFLNRLRIRDSNSILFARAPKTILKGTSAVMALCPRATVALKRGRGSATMQTQILFLKSPHLSWRWFATPSTRPWHVVTLRSRAVGGDARMFWRSSQPAV
jgi:hypothetical protein